MRAYSTAKLNVPGGDAVASVFMDRMLGVASILLMALAGLTLAGDLAGNRAIVTALFATAIVCVVTLVLIFSAGAAEAAAEPDDVDVFREFTPRQSAKGCCLAVPSSSCLAGVSGRKARSILPPAINRCP